MIGILWAWLGPVLAWAAPALGVFRTARERVTALAPMLGPLVLVGCAVLVVWMWRDARSDSEAKGAAECRTAVATATAQDLVAEMLRRQDAEAAANGARTEYEALKHETDRKAVAMERDLAILKQRGTCYPPEIVKRFNQ
jgi:hypothetical protein